MLQQAQQQLAALGQGKGFQVGGRTILSPQVVPPPILAPPPPGRGAHVPHVPLQAPVTATSGQPPITVTGCTNDTVANIIRGGYHHEGQNHGKPVYKKDQLAVSVLIYYWDERDGVTFSGWWFGPKVGGDQVWAYNMNRGSGLPPLGGWKVPWDGPVDETLKLTMGPRPHPIPPLPPAVIAPIQQFMQQLAGKGGPLSDLDRQRQILDLAQTAANNAANNEAEKKRREEEARRMEGAAALIVRKVIQRVRIATPDNFEELRTELEMTQQQQLPRMGSQAEKVLQEAERAVAQVQERVDAHNARLNAEEQRKIDAEVRKKEMAATIERVAKESTERVATAEMKVAHASEIAIPVSEIADESNPERMLEAVQATEDAIFVARTSLDSVSKYMYDQGNEFDKSDYAIQTLKNEFRPMFSRLALCRRTLDALNETTKSSKERASRKVALAKREKDQKDTFQRHDVDADGRLDRDEVIAFAKAEYDFEPAQEHLDRILKQLATDGGVPYEKFPRLRSMVAIAKSEVRAREKRAEEEEKERLRKEEEAKQAEMVAAQRSEVTKALAGIDEAVVVAETAATKTEATAKPLMVKSRELLTPDNLREIASETVNEATPAKAALTQAQERLAEFENAESTDIHMEEVRAFRSAEIAKLRSRIDSVKEKLHSANQAVKLGRDKADRKTHAQMEALRTATASAVRDLIAGQGKTGEEAFDEISAGGELDCDKFVAFVKTLAGVNIAEGQGEKLFRHIVQSPKETHISKTKFIQLVRLFYKVVKPTVLTETMSIKSKTTRRLDAGEVMEGVEGPKKDESCNVMRVKCRSVQDGTVGWVTMAGNQGTVFLEEGGNLMACVKDTIITDGLSVTESKTIRKVSKGEVIEVIEFQTKDESVDVMRINGKLKSDGTIGWVTVAGNQGTTFLEPC
mmetsp:Transcript_95307/g.269710  ORF Transcript_95307/g.269710 Transcript_95307/m.269710 type:complete len:916 (-) Transcript_95307:97-2844(-)